MVTKKKVTARSKKAVGTKLQTNLIHGRFRPESMSGKMLTLLADGKARTVAEIAKAIKPRSVTNIGTGKYAALRTFGNKTKAFKLQKTEDGKIQISIGRKSGKKAA